MDLTIRIKALAKLEGVEESDLILDEVRAFQKEHERHGSYKIITIYSPDHELEGIHLECSANDLLYTYRCPHHNPDVPVQFSSSIIYQKSITKDVDLQKHRRKGIIDYPL